MSSLEETLKEMEKLCDEATPGEWWAGHTPSYLRQGQEGEPLTVRSYGHTEEIATVWTCLLPTQANARFIAHSRSEMPRLIKALREAHEWVKAGYHDYPDNYALFIEHQKDILEGKDE